MYSSIILKMIIEKSSQSLRVVRSLVSINMKLEIIQEWWWIDPNLLQQSSTSMSNSKKLKMSKTI